jgi:hypothetical protein
VIASQAELIAHSVHGDDRRPILAVGTKLLAIRVDRGVPGAIRTHGPQIRNLVLYPAELRGHSLAYTRKIAGTKPRLSHPVYHPRTTRPSIG